MNEFTQAEVRALPSDGRSIPIHLSVKLTTDIIIDVMEFPQFIGLKREVRQ